MSNLGSTTPTPDAAGERLLRIQEVAADTGLTPADDPLLRGARPPRPGRPLGGRLPPVRRGGPRAPAVHQRPPRRRRLLLAEIGQLLEDEAARARNRATFRTSSDTGERRAILQDALARVDRQVGSIQRKIERLEAMIAEAEERRAHLAGHLEDLDAGREPTHEHPATSRHAAHHAPEADR